MLIDWDEIRRRTAKVREITLAEIEHTTTSVLTDDDLHALDVLLGKSARSDMPQSSRDLALIQQVHAMVLGEMSRRAARRFLQVVDGERDDDE